MEDSSKKITLDVVLKGETSFPLTVEELQKYMENTTHDSENMEFVSDLTHAVERAISFATFVGGSSATTFQFEKTQQFSALRLDPPGSTKTRALGITSVSTKSSMDQLLKTGTGDNTSPKISEAVTKSIIDRLLKYKLVQTMTIPADEEIYNQFLKKENQALFDLYLSSDSPKELNVSSQAKSDAQAKITLLKQVQSGEVFFLCLKEVLNNIESNAVPRFISYAERSNIGISEANWRLMMASGFFFASVIILGLLIGFRVNTLLRIPVFALLYSASGKFWGYKLKFCVILGKSKRANPDGKKQREVLEACVLKGHAKRIREYYFNTIAFSLVLSIITFVIPPYVFNTILG
jgi:hypothetical protein